MKKKLLPLVLLVVLAALAYGGLRLFHRQDARELVLYGNVDQRQVELAFLDPGRVEQVLAEEGDVVQVGQILARLDTRRLRDSMSTVEAQILASEAALEKLRNGARPEEIAQARAAVSAAEAEAAYAGRQLHRYNDLKQRTSNAGVSDMDMEAFRTQTRVAQAKLLQARQNLILVELGPRREDVAQAEAVLQIHQRGFDELFRRLDDAELRSPVQATVGSRLLEPGDMASPQRAVFSLTVTSPKWVRAYVSETDLGRIRPGMAAMVYTDSRPKQGLPGTLGFISPTAEFTPKTVQTEDLRTSLVYEVRINVQDPEDRLRMGMPATVALQVSESP